MENQIRQKLIQYLVGTLSLADFRNWFVSETWDIHLTNNPTAIALSNKIELRLAEYSSGHLPEAQLKSEIRQIIQTAELTIGGAVVSIETGSNLSEFVITLNQPQFVDTVLLEALV